MRIKWEMRDWMHTCVSLLSEKAKARQLREELVGVTELLNGGLRCGDLDDDHVVHGITVVLVPKDNTVEVLLLGRVVLGWEQDSEAVAGVWDEACRHNS